MEYRRYDTGLVLRLDPGDNVEDALVRLAEMENLSLAGFTGIGATNEFTIGVFDLETKEYAAHSFEGSYEITNLTGNLTRKDGKPYAHIHLNCAGADGKVVGGHLLHCRISLTAEIFLQILPGEAQRQMDPAISINRIYFC